VRLLPFAFVRLVCPLHSTSILPDPTHERASGPRFPQRAREYTRIPRIPSNAAGNNAGGKRDAHCHRSAHCADNPSSGYVNTVQALSLVDNRHDRSGRANDPVDAKLLRHQPERTHLDGRSPRIEPGLPVTHIFGPQRELTRVTAGFQSPARRAGGWPPELSLTRFPALYEMLQSPQSPATEGSRATSFHDWRAFYTVV
jgi:hypothetical protein